MSEVSVLSDRWPRVPFKHHARVVSGYPFESAKFNFTEGTRLVRIRDLLDDGGEILLTTETVSEAEIKDGDLLIGMDGDFNLVEWRGGRAFLNQRVCKLQPRTTAVARYLIYALPTHLKAINDLTYFTTVKHLSTFDVGNIALSLPPPAEQRRIAAYLDEQTGKIDRLMGLRRRQMDLLKEQRAALIQQAVTRGLNPRAPLKDSGLPWLGRIPKHWRLIPVKYAAQIRRGKFGHRPRTDPALYDGQFPFVQTGDVATAKKYIMSHTQTLNERGYSVSVEFAAGTLLMAIAANIGDLAILGFNACVPDSIVGLFPYSGVEAEFLYYQIACQQSWLYALAPENTQMNLNVDRFSPLKLAIPPPDEQREICRFIVQNEKQVETVLSAYARQLELLAEYRAALIHECITGQRPVEAMG
jgi:type I restriction enzyme, S subunit